MQYILSTTDESRSATCPCLQTSRKENTAVCSQLGQAHPRCLGSQCHRWLPSTSLQMAAESPCQLFPDTVPGLCHIGRSGETNRKEAAAMVPRAQIWITSPFFVVSKRYRPILDLRYLNTHLEAPHFKMEGLHMLPTVVQQDWVLAKVYLKDAYLTIPVAQEFHQLLAFQVKPGKWAQFKCLPFGLCTAPFVFTKVTKPVMQFLHQQGIHIIL